MNVLEYQHRMSGNETDNNGIKYNIVFTRAVITHNSKLKCTRSTKI